MFTLYNSLSKQKEKFSHNLDESIKWYVCGPTVYDSAHLGHARTYVTFDIMRRVFKYFGYQVNYVMNITDIDDKIINKIKEMKQEMNLENLRKFTNKMEGEFWEDMDELGVERPTVVVRVSENIEKMKEFIQKIEDNKLAYTSNGSVYFDLEEFRKRGGVMPMREVVDDDGFTENEYSGEKKNKADFALWKATNDKEEVSFSFKGLGRPGWHLECSALCHSVLGDKIDIHSGGVDLAFPHHNNEIMQTQAFHDQVDFKWVKMFLHSGHLNIEGLKMSKSLKNFITIKEFLKSHGTTRQMRLLFLMCKWDKPIDFTKTIMEEVKVIEKKLVDFVNHVEFIKKESKQKNSLSEKDNGYSNYILKVRASINALLLDNVNTTEVIKLLMEAINKSYIYIAEEYAINFVDDFKEFLVTIMNVFGIKLVEVTSNKETDKFVDLAVDLREDIRTAVMKNKKLIDKSVLKEIFGILDNFRDTKMKECGIKLEDREGKITKWCYT